MKLRIGTEHTKLGQKQAAHTQEQLHQIGTESECVLMEKKGNGGGGTKPSPLLDALQNALLRGDIDVAVFPLHLLPTKQAEGLAITALSTRENAADVLVLKKAAFDPKIPFRAKENALLDNFSDLQKTQMHQYRPDVLFQENSEPKENPLGFFQNNNIDGIFLSAAEAKTYAAELIPFEQIVLYPKEFIPAPGQGVLAWLTNVEDFTTRRILKKIHQNPVSRCTNIERQVQVLLNDAESSPIGAFCDRDANGNYHLSVVCRKDGNLKRAALSSSTHVGLAESAVGRLV